MPEARVALDERPSLAEMQRRLGIAPGRRGRPAEVGRGDLRDVEDALRALPRVEYDECERLVVQIAAERGDFIVYRIARELCINTSVVKRLLRKHDIRRRLGPRNKIHARTCAALDCPRERKAAVKNARCRVVARRRFCQHHEYRWAVKGERFPLKEKRCVG